MRTFITQSNALNIYYERFKESSRTFLWGQNCLDFVFVGRGLVPEVEEVGYLGSHMGQETDHAYMFLDMNKKQLFQGIFNHSIVIHVKEFLSAQVGSDLLSRQAYGGVETSSGWFQINNSVSIGGLWTAGFLSSGDTLVINLQELPVRRTQP